jgi:hypothetical protein
MCLRAALVLIQFSQKQQGKARKTRGGAATKSRNISRKYAKHVLSDAEGAAKENWSELGALA